MLIKVIEAIFETSFLQFPLSSSILSNSVNVTSVIFFRHVSYSVGLFPFYIKTITEMLILKKNLAVEPLSEHHVT